MKFDSVEKWKESSTLQTDQNNERWLIVWISLHANEELNASVIDNGCSNHMNSDRRKFINLKNWNGGLVKFSGKEST